jgi:hypothetical protein
MWTMGGDAAIFVVAVALIGWARRNIVVEELTLILRFGKPGLVRPVAVDSGSSKTGSGRARSAASNTGVLKSKTPHPQRLP